MKKKLNAIVLWIGLTLVVSIPASAQHLTGKIRDGATRELLPYALLQTGDNHAWYTDEQGFFSINVSEFNALDSISVSYIGYISTKLAIAKLSQDSTVSVFLFKLSSDLPLINVSAQSLLFNRSLSVLSPSVDDLERVPNIAGESDLLKSLLLLPGISGTIEGTAGLSIRGGNTSQTHLLIDGIPIYNANHIGGFLSALPSYGVKRIDVYKGGIPAKYGGRLSGVVDVQLKDGDALNKHKQFTIGTGLIRLGTEGPLFKNATYLLATRFAYPTLISRLLNTGNGKRKENGSLEAFGLYDALGKVAINKNGWEHKTSLYISGDAGFSQDELANESFIYEDFAWKNVSLSQKIRKNINGLFLFEGALQYSDYSYDYFSLSRINKTATPITNTIAATLRNIYMKSQLHYRPNVNFSCQIGASYTLHNFIHDQFSSTASEIPFELSQNGVELNTFFQFNTRLLKDMITVDGGFRFTHFHSDASFQNFQPRLKVGLRALDFITINAGIDVNAQYVHQIAADFTIFPNELWLLSNENYRPAESRQLFVGGSFWHERAQLHFGVEAFTKSLNHLTEADPYRASEQSTAGQFLEHLITNGTGRAKGLEFYIEKQHTKYNLAIAYTLSKSLRKFENINNGDWFPFSFDRRHDVSIRLFKDFNKSWRLSSSFVYQTGRAITVPTAITAQFNIYGALNNARFPSFHRLNLAVEKSWKGRKHNDITHKLVISVYNAYNRKNPYSIAIVPGETSQELDPSSGLPTAIRKLVVNTRSIFPIIPGFSYSCTFGG